MWYEDLRCYEYIRQLQHPLKNKPWRITCALARCLTKHLAYSLTNG